MKLLRLIHCKVVRRWQSFIRSEYIKIKRGTNFIAKCYTINVKKGKRRYTLLIIETYNGEYLRFNLGRYIKTAYKTQLINL